MTPTGAALVLAEPCANERNSAAVYLAGLAKRSRATMRGALVTITGLPTVTRDRSWM